MAIILMGNSMDTPLSGKVFFLQIVGAFSTCYLASVLFDIIYVLYINASSGANYALTGIFNGYPGGFSPEYRWDAFLFSPIVETLVFQVFLFKLLNNRIYKLWLVVLVISILFGWFHTFNYSPVNAVRAGVIITPITLIYIYGIERIGWKLSALSVMIAHSLLNVALVIF
ncbi:MAG: CPBP family glutamic-type intramembrane protease [Flavobacteriaceae bacterium]